MIQVVVDANRVMSALLGGLALQLLYDLRYQFIIPERTTWEVKRYLPMLAGKSGVPESVLLLAFEQMPLEAVGDRHYMHRFPDVAQTGLRDPHDRDLVALALERNAPIWSHDKDLHALTGIKALTDRDLSTHTPGQ